MSEPVTVEVHEYGHMVHAIPPPSERDIEYMRLARLAFHEAYVMLVEAK